MDGLFEILAAFNRGDLAALGESVAPDVVYRIPGRATVSGEFHGIDEVIGAFQRLRKESGDTISVDVLNAYAFRFRDGKLADGRLFPSDLHAIEAFFS